MQIKYMVLAKMHLYTNKWYDIYSVYGANHKLVHQVIWHRLSIWYWSRIYTPSDMANIESATFTDYKMFCCPFWSGLTGQFKSMKKVLAFTTRAFKWINHYFINSHIYSKTLLWTSKTAASSVTFPIANKLSVGFRTKSSSSLSTCRN